MSGAGRALLLSPCDRPGAWLCAQVAALASAHREVVVALDEAQAGPSAAPLPQRWAKVRALLAGEPKAWTTPLVRVPALTDLSDQVAALEVRLGSFATLRTESQACAQHARALGLEFDVVRAAEPACDLATSAPASAALDSRRTRALVVTRAQPFHRGHLALVQRALELADEVIVVIAAAERAFSARDPFRAGERLELVRAGLGRLSERVWLVALPAPSWPALALKQLAFVAPRYELVLAHNPVLRALATQEGKRAAGLEQRVAWQERPLCASAIRQRLVEQGAGDWLFQVLPEGTAALLLADAALAERCALIAATEG